MLCPCFFDLRNLSIKIRDIFHNKNKGFIYNSIFDYEQHFKKKMGRSFEVIVLSVLALVLLSVPTGYAIHCFSCNSDPGYDGDECWNLTPEMNTSKYYVNCENVTPPKEGMEYERCRVNVQTVEGKTRLIRSCATWPDHDEPSRCIDRTGTNKIKLRYCECNENGCNMAPSLYVSFITVWAAVGAAVILH